MIYELARRAYNATLRHRLPRKIVVYNGVAVRAGGLFDATDVKPDYEASLIAAMRERITPGDRVVIVGGGRGVSAVVACRRVGPEGSVTVYEGAASQVDLVRETLDLNEASDGVTVKHAIVGDPHELWSEGGDAERVDASDLPESDVLVLDCEGSEVEIIRDGTLPQTVIAETHGVFDAPTAQTRSLLEDRGYEIRSDRVEIADEDVHVLTAVRT
jgi:hypothetical protein